VLSIGLLFAKGAGIGDFELLAASIYVLAGLTVVTVAQRIWHVRGQLAGKESVAAEVTEVEQEGNST